MKVPLKVHNQAVNAAKDPERLRTFRNPPYESSTCLSPEARAKAAHDLMANAQPLRRSDIESLALKNGITIEKAPDSVDYGQGPVVVKGTLDQLEHFARAVLRHSLGSK